MQVFEYVRVIKCATYGIVKIVLGWGCTERKIHILAEGYSTSVSFLVKDVDAE